MTDRYLVGKFFAVLLITSFAGPLCLPYNTQATCVNDRGKVLVALGDSYSSGEGIEPFFGQDKKRSEKVNIQDWVAHRSENAWSGQLLIPDADGKMSEVVRDKNWFFVAASGAVTENYYYKQKKKCFNGKYVENKYLDAQEDIFDKLKEKNITPDYVTLTLGGNDASFADIIATAGICGKYFAPGALADKLNNVWDEYTDFGGIRDRLLNVYSNISGATDKKAQIIVAGYPTLLNSEGGGPFSSAEADLINSNVKNFNTEISKLVQICRDGGMNITFVPVDMAFAGHEAYTNDPYINEVIFIPREQDINPLSPVPISAYSIHPNIVGAQVYAKCVQNAINEMEGIPSNWADNVTQGPHEVTISNTPTPTASPTPDPNIKIDEENFPDKEFRRCVSNEFDLDHNGVLSPKEISKVTYFDLYDESGDELVGEGPFMYGVKNLQGLEFLSNLEGLEVPFVDVSSVDISKNPKLKNITFFECNFENITIRCGQTITLDHISTTAWRYDDRKREYLADVSDKEIVSRSFPTFGSEATLLTGIKAGEVTVNGKDYVFEDLNGKINVFPDDSYTQKKKPKVSVKNAVEKQFTFYGEKYNYKIPEVSISGKDMKAINKKIKEDLKDYLFYDGGDELDEKIPYAITYSKYVDDNIISICVRVQCLEDEAFDNEYFIYNISVKTGKLMKDIDVVKYCDGDDENVEKEFFKTVRELLMDIIDDSRPDSADDDWVNSVKELNNQTVDKKFKYIKPYISSKGHYRFVIPIEWWGAMGTYNVKVDMYTRDIKWEN